MWGVFQLVAFLSVFFEDLTPFAFYIRNQWQGYRATYMSQGNIMFGWQKAYEFFDLTFFGLGFAPSTYRCATMLFIRGLWKLPHNILFDVKFEKFWARTIDAEPEEEVVEEEEEEE